MGVVSPIDSPYFSLDFKLHLFLSIIAYDSGSHILTSKWHDLAFPLQVIQSIRVLEHRRRRLGTLIDRLVAACLEMNPEVLAGLPRLQMDTAALFTPHSVQAQPAQLLLRGLVKREQDCQQLEDYVSRLLSRIKDAPPEVIKRLVDWLDAAVPNSESPPPPLSMLLSWILCATKTSPQRSQKLCIEITMQT